MKHVNLRSLLYFLLVLLYSFQTISCNSKPGDAEIQQNVKKQLGANQGYSGVNVAVQNGVVTLSGNCEGDGCAQNIEQQVKGVKGVDKIVNNVSQANEGIDYTLRTSVQTIISKYPGVSADVAAGVVVLRGTIARDQLQPLMVELSNLKPKKIDNQLAIQ